MLPLSRLLEVDAHHSFPEAIPDCLGDRYLCMKNSIYRTVRLIALEDGVRFSCCDTPLWRDYQTAALLCLDRILGTNTIPYSDTTVTLQRVVEEVNPAFSVNVKLLLQVLKRNYLLHESCHCIAHKRIPAMCSDESESSPQQQTVVRLLLGEAFSTTVERMAWTMVDSPTHALFFNLNSYVEHSPQQLELVKEVLQEVGLPLLFRLSMIVFFWNNLEKRPLNEAEVADILDYFYGANSSVRAQRDKLVVLFTKVLSISERFLKETTPAYFRLIGLEDEFEKLIGSGLTVDRVARLFDGRVLDELTALITRPCFQAAAISA